MRLLHPDFPDERPATVDQALALLGIEDGRILGDEMAICCPFHYEYHPSFSINVSSGMWICFKGCGQGNLAGLAEKVLDVPYALARRWVSGVNYGVDGPGVPDVDEPGWYEEDWYAERFAVPPQQKLDERRITAEVAAGLSIRWDWGDRAWILPARDPDTKVIWGWQCKTSGSTWMEKGTPKSKTLFGIDVFEAGTTAILVESPLDVAVLATAGLKGGLSSFGAGDHPRQRALLSDRASQIVLALDNDDAGREAQAKLVAKLRGKEVFEFNYGTSEAKDIGEMDKDEIYDGLRYATRATGRSW